MPFGTARRWDPPLLGPVATLPEAARSDRGQSLARVPQPPRGAVSSCPRRSFKARGSLTTLDWLVHSLEFRRVSSSLLGGYDEPEILRSSSR